MPVSVASASCYTQDLNVPVGGTRGRDGARAFNLVHVYPDTVLHSVVPLGETPALDFIDADETRRRLATAGVEIADAAAPVPAPTSADPPYTEPIPILA